MEEWAIGGLSAEAFAEAHNVNAGTLQWWASRLRSVDAARTVKRTTPRLIPVNVVGAVEPSDAPERGWELSWGDGTRLRVHAELTPAALRAVVALQGTRGGRR